MPEAIGHGLASVSASSATDIWAVWKGLYHWNGSTWSRFSAPGLGGPDTVLSGIVAVASGDAWAVGYTSFLGSPQTLTQRWNGTTWSVVPSPTISGGSELDAVAAAGPNDVWAVGSRAGGLPDFQASRVTLTIHWDGSAWTAVPSPNISNRSHELLDVCAIAPNDVWAVGSWRNIGGDYQTLIIHWDGSAWSLVPSPNFPGENNLYGVSGTSANDVWAVGGAWDGVMSRQIFLHWDGSSWSQVNGPGGPTACVGCSGDVLALGPNDVWAVGNTIGHWDGTAWSLVPNPDVPDSYGITVRSLAKIGPCDAWAVGGSFSFEGTEDAFSVHLTAGGGTVNLPPVAMAQADPASGPGPLEVHFSSAGSHDPDGSIVSYSWNFGDGAMSNSSEPNPVHTYLQTGLLTYHATLQVLDDDGAITETSVQVSITPPMYVESQSVAQVPEPGAGTWYAQDVVLITGVDDLPVAGATVRATFTGPTSGTVSGTTGADGRVTLETAATADTGSAWCFTVTGVEKSGHVYAPPANPSQCEGGSVTGVDQGPGSFALWVMPNPSRGENVVHLTLPAPQAVALAIHDVSGRLVRALVSGHLVAGPHALRWDGRDHAGRPVEPGIYFVTARAGGRRISTAILRTR
jgi:hypothetical protein